MMSTLRKVQKRRKKVKRMTEKNISKAERKRRVGVMLRHFSFRPHIRQLVKKIHQNQRLSISLPSIYAIESFIQDCFHDLASQAADLLRKTGRSVLKEKDFQYAVVHCLPGQVSRHALSAGRCAISSYMTYFERDN